MGIVFCITEREWVYGQSVSLRLSAWSVYYPTILSLASFSSLDIYVYMYIDIYIYPQLQLRNASHNIKAEGKGNTNKIISKIKKIKIKSYKKEVKIINKTPSTELSKIFNEKPPPPPPPPLHLSVNKKKE
ncbi:hypothetical protein TWF594_003448 [Orbilia oligospora]|nr:hypothetical protein TWF594_003448 [Orbilia oligospora]